MKKRLFSAVLSSAIIMSTLGSMSSSALLTLDTDGSESYNKRIESLNKNFTTTPELPELAANVFPELNVENIWVRQANDQNYTECVIEISRSDYITFDSEVLPKNDEDVEALLNEIKAELGYEDLIKISANSNGIKQYSNISIWFVEENHQLNYMIAEKAYAIIKDKCEISSIYSEFASKQFIKRLLRRGVYIHDISDEEENTRLKEIYELVDHDMLKEKYRATFEENGLFAFPEDITFNEKFQFFKYLVETYDLRIGYEDLASNDSMTVGEADFSEITYLDGDANHDKIMTIADAAAIFQSLANPDKYQLSAQGEFNADSKGDGITVDDAVRIQKKLAGITE
jgi:ribosomal protein L20A (L18A)